MLLSIQPEFYANQTDALSLEIYNLISIRYKNITVNTQTMGEQIRNGQVTYNNWPDRLADCGKIAGQNPAATVIFTKQKANPRKPSAPRTANR